MEDKEEVQEIIVSPEKLRKLRNLKYFRDWTDEQIIEWAKNRKKNDVPPPSPIDIVKDIPVANPGDIVIDEQEYENKFKKYLTKYKKELAVDMNNANDAE